MAKRTIFTVGFNLPGDDFEYVPFHSDRSLLDADIVLFEPGFGATVPLEDYEGTDLFSKSASPRVIQQLSHWKSELISFVNGGNLAVIYLKKPLRYYVYTGEKSYSGPGRSRVTTNHVAEVRSYLPVPKVKTAEAKSGSEVRLTSEAGLITPYWKEFAQYSNYEAFIVGEFTSALTTKRGNKTVGAVFSGKGTLLYLPPLHLPSKFSKYDGEDAYWTGDALKFGKRLAAALAGIATTISKRSGLTPPPSWARQSQYETEEESSIAMELSKLSGRIAKLEEKRTALQQELQNAGDLKLLLYEQGRPLERAVREALTLFGFEAEPFGDGESEFDVVFQSAEGRFLGEVEGKDNRAVNIDKLSQLERNLQEDFARDEVSEFAKGVLFGNAHRLMPPGERPEAFTTKCTTGANRANVALVCTADMFEPARYLRAKSDSAYARECREALFRAAGAVVEFPPPPDRVEAEVESDDD